MYGIEKTNAIGARHRYQQVREAMTGPKRSVVSRQTIGIAATKNAVEAMTPANCMLIPETVWTIRITSGQSGKNAGVLP